MKGVIEPLTAAHYELGFPVVTLTYVLVEDAIVLRVEMTSEEETAHINVDPIKALYAPDRFAQFNDVIRMLVAEIKCIREREEGKQ